MLDLLFKKTGGKNITVTMGAKGSLSRKRNNTSYHMPAFSNIAVDTIGAGDAYLSTFSAFYSLGVLYESHNKVFCYLHFHRKDLVPFL